MALPPALEQGFSDTVNVELEKRGMPYVTSWERQDLQDVLLDWFENVPSDILGALDAIQGSQVLRVLNRAAAKSETLESFRAALARHTAA